MANIHDYLAWRKDVPFSVSPFNEVDSLVLSELIYADFDGVVPSSGELVSIEEACRRFWALHTREEILARERFTRTAPLLMEAMAGEARYGGTRLSHYYSVLDPEADVQLAAMTFWLPDGTAFAAFRGTDGTVVGWKEDFLLSYLPETEGQRRAAAYLNRVFGGGGTPLRVGGHSKGGNLAVYAAVCAGADVRGRITAVYSNDGPGFLDDFLQTDAYREMLPRIVCTVPAGTVIGALLSSQARRHVVKSSATGILQHDGFTWQVEGPRFLEAEKRTEPSLLLEATMGQWLDGRSGEEKRLFVDALFAMLEATGADTFSQMKKEKGKAVSSMWKILEAMPRETREAVWGMLAQLVKTGSGNVMQDARRGFSGILGTLTSPTRERDEKRRENT